MYTTLRTTIKETSKPDLAVNERVLDDTWFIAGPVDSDAKKKQNKYKAKKNYKALVRKISNFVFVNDAMVLRAFKRYPKCTVCCTNEIGMTNKVLEATG